MRFPLKWTAILSGVIGSVFGILVTLGWLLVWWVESPDYPRQYVPKNFDIEAEVYRNGASSCHILVFQLTEGFRVKFARKGQPLLQTAIVRKVDPPAPGLAPPETPPKPRIHRWHATPFANGHDTGLREQFAARIGGCINSGTKFSNTFQKYAYGKGAWLTHWGSSFTLILFVPAENLLFIGAATI